MAGVLDGIRVLDFGRYIAGPWCAALLADFGADVIHIERLSGGEDRYVAPVTDNNVGSLFLQMNRNKRGMTLDTRSEEGKEILRRLVESADVVVANLPDAGLKALGLDYESLCAIKPDIILTSATAFGTTGPYATKVGFDPVAQAMSGSMHLTAYEEPMRCYASWVDFGTATLAAYGTLAAIMARNATGQGQQVQGSLLGTAVTTMGPVLIEQALTNVNRVGTGNRGQVSAPSDVFKTKDGWIFCLALGEPMHKRWAELMGEDHWLTDERFSTDEKRGEHGEIYSERMSQWAAERTTEQALEELEKSRIPASPIFTPQEALDDRHINEAGFLKPIDIEGAPKPVPMADTPIKLSKTPGGIRSGPPKLGEHTDEVLASLGYSAADIDRLHSVKAV